MDRDHLLNELLPYHMQAVETLNLALNLNGRWGAAPMTLYAADKLVVEGTLPAGRAESDVLLTGWQDL
jgi:hypothetical protein